MELLSSLGVRSTDLARHQRRVFDLSGADAAQRAVIGRELDAVYREFTRQVSEARKLDAGRIDTAARTCL